MQEILELFEEILHELTTMHGLWATDNLDLYRNTERSPDIAWRAFRNAHFQLELLGLIEKVQDRLDALRAGNQKEAKCQSQ